MTESQRWLKWFPIPNPPINHFRVREDVTETVPSSDQVLRNPEGRTVATESGEDGEWSDENIESWLQRDRLDPEFDEWVRATLGE